MLPSVPKSFFATLVSPHGAFSPGVIYRVLAFGAVATIVCALNRLGYGVHLPVGLHEVAGAVIALILAFRTNTAYARFWEGRTLWGGIVNACRNLTRAVDEHAHLEEKESRSFRTWVVVYAHATRRSLRVQSEHPEISRLITPEDDEAFSAAPHQPLHAARRLSETIADLARQGRLNPMMQAHAESLVAALVDYLGGCERIAKTPTPAGYIFLLARCIAFYLATLPLALVTEVGGFTIPVTMMVAYLVLMIEGLGRELDAPFDHDPNDLPLSRICTTIEQNLLGSSPEEILRGEAKRRRYED